MFVYYKMVSDLEEFVSIRRAEEVLCDVVRRTLRLDF